MHMLLLYPIEEMGVDEDVGYVTDISSPRVEMVIIACHHSGHLDAILTIKHESHVWLCHSFMQIKSYRIYLYIMEIIHIRV